MGSGPYSRLGQVAVEQIRQRNLDRYDAGNTTASLTADIDRHGDERREALQERLRTLLRVLRQTTPAANDTSGLLVALEKAVQPLDHATAWLVLAVVSARMPSSGDVENAVRLAASDGFVAALRGAIWRGPLPQIFDGGPFRPVAVIEDAVLVDVDHTAQVTFATGIQRVTRETTRRWLREYSPTLVGWDRLHSGLRALTPPEIRRACWGGPPAGDLDPGPVLIPQNCTYLLPELATEVARTDALRCLAQYSSNRFAVIGYDMVPITVPETTGPDMPAAFARNLAAVRYATCVAAISEASALDYRHWVEMLVDIGVLGPRVVACPLPNEGVAVTLEDRAHAAERLLVGLPLVLVIGSHEPRKNHVAVLQAAELLWREGLQFSLTFIGGNSWNSEVFQQALGQSEAAGRPVETIPAATDTLIWSAYRLARFTVFPSLSEGFGLPIVESLSCGTPVITSDYGAMREAAAGGGALLVDPRDDHALAAAMRDLLTNDQLLAELKAEALEQQTRTWDDYAAITWAELTA